MPKNLPLKEHLPFIMSRPMYEILLMGWISRHVSLGTSMTVLRAIEDFMEFYQIPPEYWDRDTAAQFYYKNNDGMNEQIKFNNIKPL